jgi:hypothetical protein
MKKFIALTLCATMSLTLFACGKQGDSETSKTNPSESVTESSSLTPETSETTAPDMTEGTSLPDMSDSTGPDTTMPGEPEPNVELTAMMSEICQGVDLPESNTFTLDQSAFEAYSFAAWQEGVEAVCSEALINVVPHSLVLVKTQDGKAEDLAKEIADKANVRKWICVQAELGKVLYTDNYVFLMMTEEAVFDQLKANFEKATGAQESMVLDVKSAEME